MLDTLTTELTLPGRVACPLSYTPSAGDHPDDDDDAAGVFDDDDDADVFDDDDIFGDDDDGIFDDDDTPGDDDGDID